MRGAESANLGVRTKVPRSVPSRSQAEDGDGDGDDKASKGEGGAKGATAMAAAHETFRWRQPSYQWRGGCSDAAVYA